MDRPTKPPKTSQPPSPSSTTSSSSVDIIVPLDSIPQKALGVYIDLGPEASSPYDFASLHPHEVHTVARRLRGLDKIYSRRAAHWTALELAHWRKRKLKILWLTTFADKLLQEPCIKREIKRAKRTKILPQSFQTIDIQQYDNELHTTLQEPGGSNEVRIDACNDNAFAGRIVIQDALSAMKQALAEHSKHGTLSSESGRHSYHVDAAISDEYGLTGLAVVHKTHGDDEKSPWTVQGFQINGRLESTDAETWAIWQALRHVRQKVQADRAEFGHDPCAVAVIYSDCLGALQRIGKTDLSHQIVTKMTIKESIELRCLGVDVCLHWVPGHRNVPGNELADLVAKRAGKPMPQAKEV